MTEVKHFEPTNQCFWNSERFDSLSNASLVVRFQLPPHGSRGQKRNFIPKPVDPTEKSIFDEWKPARSHHAFHPPRSQFIIIFPKIKSYDLSVRPIHRCAYITSGRTTPRRHQKPAKPSGRRFSMASRRVTAPAATTTTITALLFLLLLPLPFSLAAAAATAFNLSTLPFDDGFSHLFGNDNLVRCGDGRSARLTLNRYSGTVLGP